MDILFQSRVWVLGLSDHIAPVCGGGGGIVSIPRVGFRVVGLLELFWFTHCYSVSIPRVGFRVVGLPAPSLLPCQ